MAEFCTCGSIVINGHCTNKNCVNKATTKSVTAKAASAKALKEKKEAKPTRTRRSSKCVTYNLYESEIKEEENVN